MNCNDANLRFDIGATSAGKVMGQIVEWPIVNVMLDVTSCRWFKTFAGS